MVTTSRRATKATRTATPVQDVASRLRFAITRTNRRMRQQAGADLSPTQIAALATIERCGPLTPSELAEIEKVKRPTATRVSAFLAEKGLIDRTAHPSDGRGSLLSATPEGSMLLRRLRTRKDTYLAQQLAGLTPTELATLGDAAGILERLLAETPTEVGLS